MWLAAAIIGVAGNLFLEQGGSKRGKRTNKEIYNNRSQFVQNRHLATLVTLSGGIVDFKLREEVEATFAKVLDPQRFNEDDIITVEEVQKAIKLFRTVVENAAMWDAETLVIPQDLTSDEFDAAHASILRLGD